MNIEYKWSVWQMDCFAQEGGETEVVYIVYWSLIGIDPAYPKAVGSVIDNVELQPYKSGEPFTPYNQLTETQVLTWVQEKLGQTKIDEYKADIAAQVSAQIDPVIITPPLPWNP